MFRSSSSQSDLDPRLKPILEAISPDLFGTDEALDSLDFAAIEQRAHDIGRSVARQLCEGAAARQTRSIDGPRDCPDCKRSCPGSVVGREFL